MTLCQADTRLCHMFAKVKALRARFGLVPAIVVAVVMVAVFVVDQIGNIDTIRALADTQHPHWLVRILTAVSLPPILGWFLLLVGAGFLFVFLAIELQERRAKPDVAGLAGSLRLSPWREGDPGDSRPEYRDWLHVTFQLEGRKRRGRAYIEVKGNGNRTTRREACIADFGSFEHERRELRPGDEYIVPVFTRMTQQTVLWVDRKQKEHSPAYQLTPVAPGAYITDRAFMEGLHRQPLRAGTYRVRVVVIVGNVPDHKEYRTVWKQVDVPADEPGRPAGA